MNVIHRGRKSSHIPKPRVRRAVSLVALVAMGAVGSAEFAAARPSPRVEGATLWVTDRAGQPGGLFAVDATSGEVVRRVAVGVNPIGAVAPRGSEKIYTSNETSNSVSVVSRVLLSEVKQIPTGTGSKPHHLAQSTDGRFVYAALFGTSTVAVIDTRTDTQVRTLAMSSRAGIKTHAVWVAVDGRTLYAANTFAPTPTPELSGTVSAVDVATGARMWEIEVGRNPSEVLVTATGTTAYVSVRDEDVVKALDLSTSPPTISGQGFVGDAPDTLQLTNEGRTLVVALRGAPAQVTFLNTSTLVANILTVPGTTTGHQWVSADGRYTYLAVEDPSTPGIAVIDNGTATLVDKFPLPAGSRPHGVFYEPEGLRQAMS